MNRMELHSKYLTGFFIIGALCIGYFILVPISPLFSYVYLGFSSEYLGILLTTIGVLIFIIGLIFYYLLYSSERIKGFKAEYEISPDLTQFKAIPYSKDGSSVQKEETPDKAFCSYCGKEIFQPFQCNICKQLLCGKHYLPGEHPCMEGEQ